MKTRGYNRRQTITYLGQVLFVALTLILNLLPLGLFAKAARAERVHDQERRCQDRPGHDERAADQCEGLHARCQAHKTRFRVRFHE